MPGHLRVVQLTTSFPINRSSASGSFVSRLVSSLPGHVESTVVVPAAQQPPDVPESRYRVRAFRYAPWRWQRLAHVPGGVPVALSRNPALYGLVPVFLLSMFLSCARELRHARLVHAHWSVNGVVAGLAARLSGKPCVTTLWGEDVTRSASSRLYRGLLWLCIWLSHRTISVSQAMHGQMVARFPAFRHKLAYIPNGVDETFAAPAVAPAALPAREFRILFVGSLIERKSVLTLVEACARLDPAQRAGWQVTLVGAGAEAERLRALASERGIADQVAFAGSVAPAEVAHFYRQADVFVLPSRSEGMPSVVLEAMAAGLPVVATDIDGVRELIGHAREGFLFPVGDSAALASLLHTLSSDPALRARMGREAHEAILRGGFLWPAVSERYATLYAELARP